MVSKGVLTRRVGGVASRLPSLADDKAFQVIRKSFDAVQEKLLIPDGSAVIIIDGSKYYEVVIGHPPAAGVLGPDYTAKVMVDKKSLAIVEILASGRVANLWQVPGYAIRSRRRPGDVSREFEFLSRSRFLQSVV